MLRWNVCFNTRYGNKHVSIFFSHCNSLWKSMQNEEKSFLYCTCSLQYLVWFKEARYKLGCWKPNRWGPPWANEISRSYINQEHVVMSSMYSCRSIYYYYYLYWYYLPLFDQVLLFISGFYYDNNNEKIY